MIESSLPEKEDFHSCLNMEGITDSDYTHAKRVCKYFKIKNFGRYHDLHIQSDKVLLADVFENFRNMSLKIYEIDSAKFLSGPGLAWQAVLKNAKVKLDLLIDINMLLIVEKGVTGGIYHSIYPYAKANNKYMKDYHKNKQFSYLQLWDVNIFYGWRISQRVPINNFVWIEDTSQFKDAFIKNYNEESDERYFFKLGFNILKIYMNFIMIYHS